MAKILLVEDDPILGKGLHVNLSLEGYQADWAQDLKSARYSNSMGKYDLILLDVNLPDGSGFTLLEEIRKAKSRVPIIVLTAKSDEDSVVEGLSLGANDYIRKPFSQKELLARIKTALREPILRENQHRLGTILILQEQRKVLIEEKEIDFNRREFDIFSYLVQHPKAVISRESLIQALNQSEDINDRTIDSHLSHIRSKLKKSEVSTVSIKSVYGVGYTLEYS